MRSRHLGDGTPPRPVGPFLVALVLALLAAAGCGGPDAPPPTGGGGPGGDPGLLAGTLPDEEGDPRPGGNLRLALPLLPGSWNPVTEPPGPSSAVAAGAVFEPLLRVGASREPEPWLATSVTPDAAGAVWTIVVREGVRFHDGTELSAAVVAANLEARRDTVLGAQALAPVAAVTVVNATTVDVTMRRPWFGFDRVLTSPLGWMVSAATLRTPERVDGTGTSTGEDGAAVETDEEPGEPGAEPEGAGTAPDQGLQPAGTGPYLLEPIASGAVADRRKLVRHEDYWGGPPPLEAVELLAVPDDQTRADLLAAGEVDLVLTSRTDDLVRFVGRDGFRQTEDPFATEQLVILNSGTGPFDDPELRRAAVLAVDPVATAETLSGSLGRPASGPFAEGETWAVDDDGHPAPDPTEAAAIVEALEGDGEALSIEILVGPTVSDVRAAAAVAEQWEAVGLDAGLEIRTQPALDAAVRSGDYQAAVVRGFGGPDPETLWPRWHRSGSGEIGAPAHNVTRFVSADLDAALEQLRRSSDTATRWEHQAEAVRQANAGHSQVWLLHDTWGLLATDRVGGLRAPELLGFGRGDQATWWPDIWLRE